MIMMMYVNPTSPKVMIFKHCAGTPLWDIDSLKEWLANCFFRDAYQKKQNLLKLIENDKVTATAKNLNLDVGCKDKMKSFLDEIRERFNQVKKIIGHIGLYLGLIVFTALGALVSQSVYK